jgi:hypothetical protein
MSDFQELADEAFRDLLKKHGAADRLKIGITAKRRNVRKSASTSEAESAERNLKARKEKNHGEEAETL